MIEELGGWYVCSEYVEAQSDPLHDHYLRHILL